MMAAINGRAAGRAVTCLISGFALAAATPLLAQDTIPRRLPPVVVTRDKARSPLDLPYAISTVRPDSLSPGQPHTMPEQTLFLLPGITVANRNNPSQDARISIRGFGARSQFGVRSLRVLRDGMPLTMPDGQTPLDYLDLESVGRVETIRGSASSLYGNASGGVINLRSTPPPSAPLAGAFRTWAGDNAMRRNTLLLGGTSGATSYTGSIGRTQSDGVRRWSNQQLTNTFFRAGTEFRGTEFAVIGMGLDMPVAQNPGALTRIQFDTNPEMADPQSITKRARKAVHQAQVGLQARRTYGDGEMEAQVYEGRRTLDNPLAFSVVGIGRHTSGASLRYTYPPTMGAVHAFRLTFGAEAQSLNDARKNWANCNGLAVPTATCPVIGVDKGNLSLDQREKVQSFGAYAREDAEFGPANITAGFRVDRTQFAVLDKYLSDGRNDSGDRTMEAFSPMAGVTLRVTPQQSVYFTLSTAFETPTTTELANQPTGIAGLNTTLDPQYSRTTEVGAKGRAFDVIQYDFALYATTVKDELIPFDIGSGRVAYQNAGRTRRRGGEGSLSYGIGPLALNAAFTYSEFTFVNFLSGTTQMAGKSIPGIPVNQVQFSAAYHHRLGFALVEWQAKDKIWVNDANLAAAPGYALVNVRAGANAAFHKAWLSPVFGVQNALNREYVASVAVNAAGTVTTGKFYEPGPGRTWYVGLSAATASW
jgi:iron complex outermembrane receptor protein